MTETTPALRVLVADDERFGRKRVRDLLAAEPGVEVVATAETGRQAVEAIREHRPDVAFLDVQMPDGTGLDVVRAVGPAAMPATVFVTAFDEHALEAFRLAALDYLTKPFEDERFVGALARVREAVRLRREADAADDLRQRYQALLDASAGTPEAPSYLAALPVESRSRVRFVPVEQIDVIEADGPYAVLHVGGGRHLIRERMQTLEDRLDPALFVRVHRSTIVRLDLVDELLIGGQGDYAVRLADGREVRVSRSRRVALEARLRRDPTPWDEPPSSRPR